MNLEDLVEELRDIITEAVFTHRWSLVEGYWLVGQRINQEEHPEDLIEPIATALQRSKRTIWYAVQFNKKFKSLDDVPDGKNASWHKVINKYLPDSKREKDRFDIISDFLDNAQHKIEELNKGVLELCP